jgi:hypothetical protein
MTRLLIGSVFQPRRNEPKYIGWPHAFEVYVAAGLFMFTAKFGGAELASLHRAVGEDGDCVSGNYIRLGTFKVIVGLRLLEDILFRNKTVFGFSHLGARAAMRNLQLPGGIQPASSVGSILAADITFVIFIFGRKRKQRPFSQLVHRMQVYRLSRRSPIRRSE